MRFLASWIIFADRSIAVMVPPSSFSHTSDTATPRPQPISKSRSSGSTASVSTAHTSRSDALPLFTTPLYERLHRSF
ncbi:MAG TPA: hypothetical protein VI027_06755, partial [Rubrobacteraceae bacterium]